MQATLDAAALKPFTRALTCLSKYGEELTIHATPASISLSAVNSAKSAYCRFKFARYFFSKYRINGDDTRLDGSDIEEVVNVTGQLLTKALLSILKHRTVEKTVERCEMAIIEGVAAGENTEEDQDSLESKLVVKLHCKHGVVKTHRLLLLATTSLMTPNVPDSSLESRLTVAPKALKDMIEHFSINKGPKSDPQLIWRFEYSDITLRTMESSLDGKGRSGLSTELAHSVDEFDSYEIQDSPITIAFHLRELTATIAFAESLNALLEIHFTEPAAPLFIDVEEGSIEGLFVISTIQPPGTGPPNSTQNTASNARKREREETPHETPRIRKSMKVIQHTPLPSGSRSNREQSVGSMLPPSSARSTTFFNGKPNAQSTPRSGHMPPPPPPSSTRSSSNTFYNDNPLAQSTPHNNMPPPPLRPHHHRQLETRERPEEPLFLPISSQLSQAEVETLRSTGLGIEDMDAEDLRHMLEDEGEEVAFDFSSQPNLDMDEPELEFIATQTPSNSSSKPFRPLFDD